MYIKAWRNKMDFTGSAKPRCVRGREGHCFAVCALVCDLSLKAECVPAFACESKREPFVREVEMRKKTDLRSECADNFWTIFAGTVLDEKPNFTGKFFEWRRPFDFSTR